MPAKNDVALEASEILAFIVSSIAVAAACVAAPISKLMLTLPGVTATLTELGFTPMVLATLAARALVTLAVKSETSPATLMVKEMTCVAGEDGGSGDVDAGGRADGGGDEGGGDEGGGGGEGGGGEGGGGEGGGGEGGGAEHTSNEP